MRNLTLAIVGTIFILAGGAWAAGKETVLYSFNGVSDGGFPRGAVIFDKAGNLYGEAGYCNIGQDSAWGDIFKLKRNKKAWTMKVLYAFSGSGDGGCPTAVTLDDAGNLYGTTIVGGSSGADDGVVFSLTRSQHWTESVYYEFLGEDDGFSPAGPLLRDHAGNLYGTAEGGQYEGYGVVYELSPNANGSWTYTALHEFSGGSNDGGNPFGGVAMDAVGNIYGMTSEGGSSCNCGVVYELSPNSGTWTETILYAFTGSPDGANPEFAQPTIDKSGDLYGTTERGGANNDGTVFELKKSNGKWKEIVLHSFSGSDGLNPETSVTLDRTGDLYGVTGSGGASNQGVVYKLSHSKGKWRETVLHSFTGGADGGNPVNIGGPAVDAAGNIYGTTYGGGKNSAGAVFEIVP
jgi:uncharacterized repeat protein (TIGR03803 family)